MAMSPKSISFFLLISLFFSIQIHARDSQFFSKVSSSTTTNNEKEKATTTTITASPTKQPEEEPTFIPQTQNDNYGLYSSQYQDQTDTQIPTTTKLAGSLEESNADVNTKTNIDNDNHYYYYRPNTNNKAYEEEQQRERDQQEQQEEDKFVQTSLQDVENSGYPSKTSTNTESKATNQNQYYYNTNTETKSSTNQNQYNNNNAERQGMSDTRFLKNGRYFYDLANEKNMYYNPNSQLESTGSGYTTTTTTSNPQGYYNNYNNNEQFSESRNPTGYYPEEEEEFHASENEQYVP